ncbi:MAG: ATPase, T2SS/T4P/T4SS family, partial [Deltaproteobacteria bacterium]
VKIWTAEDPVEIVQDGISQVQVAPARSFGFAEALKAFLRADPDVIFVGEIRDGETAKTAGRASLTGHLVLSTLHSGTAVDALVRLSHNGITGLDLSESLRCALAQRLVRRLCPHCAVPANPAAEDAPFQDSQKAKSSKLLQASAAGCTNCHGSGTWTWRPLGPI